MPIPRNHDGLQVRQNSNRPDHLRYKLDVAPRQGLTHQQCPSVLNTNWCSHVYLSYVSKCIMPMTSYLHSRSILGTTVATLD